MSRVGPPTPQALLDLYRWLTPEQRSEFMKLVAVESNAAQFLEHAHALPATEFVDVMSSLSLGALNPPGAWCLGLAEEYRPTAPRTTDDLRVLANLDVVAARPPSAADRLTLERFADETSPAVWKLSAAKVLAVIEQGGRVEELSEFLAARAGDIPPAVETFLGDLRRKAGMLKDGGPARLIECANEHVAAELANDRQLKGKCRPAGGRRIGR